MWRIIGLRKEEGLHSILTASTATGQLVLLPILAMMIEHYSWRWAIALIIVLSSIMLMIIALFMKNKPMDVGLLAYGLDERLEDVAVENQECQYVIAFNGLFEAVKVKAFWLLAGSLFICELWTVA
ncbi:MFS transporter OS=Lysinibacillus sphaericus OX=1421 GN=LS41612_07420 PE=4 SV=1 [Lysinibacillus sphaericus]